MSETSGCPNARQGSYEVAAGARAIYVRVHGLASMNNCLCLRDFIEDMFAASHTFLIVDLADCTGIDSTFMGLLAGAAQFRRDERQASVAVVNANDCLVKLLKSVGVAELVFLEPEEHDVPELEFVALHEEPDEERRLALIRWAHKRLLAITKRNEEIFGRFLNTLESEMRRRGFDADK